MIPDIVCIWVSLFLAQRPSSATFLLARRCHSTWRNAASMELSMDMWVVVGFEFLMRSLSQRTIKPLVRKPVQKRSIDHFAKLFPCAKTRHSLKIPPRA
jgi:hypothetical protein